MKGKFHCKVLIQEVMPKWFLVNSLQDSPTLAKKYLEKVALLFRALSALGGSWAQMFLTYKSDGNIL